MSDWQRATPLSLTVQKKWKLGVVTARFNSSITAELQKGAIARLQQLGASDRQILSVEVPGAVEIPLAAQWLLEKKKLDGVIALGCVVRGETPHFDYVCQSAERGCTHLQLKLSKPVVFGVLTTENMAQAKDRIGGRHGHKGQDAAETLVEMLLLKEKLIKKSKQKTK